MTLDGFVIEMLRGLAFGLGFAIAFNIIGYPFRRWAP